MNALELLRPPWVASARSSRWLALVLCVALILAEIAELVMLDGPARAVAAGATWCCALGLWWLLVVPNALWLGRDATVLRLPRVRHLGNASVWAYAFLTAAVPATVLALILGHALVWYAGFALAITGCLLFLLLPSVVWIGIFIVFVAVTNLHFVHFKAPGIDRLTVYGTLLALALAGLTIWRWFRVLDMRAPEGLGLGSPVIWNLRAQAALGFFGPFGRNAEAVLARSIRPWLAPTPDVRHTGPAYPVRTIRTALGRNVMPQTASSRLRLGVYSMAMMALLMSPSIIAAAHGGLHHAFRTLLVSLNDGLGLAAVFAAIFPLLAAMIYGWRLPLRWTTANADLALLGLLPQLGDGASVQRSMVLACLSSVMYMGAFEFLLLCASGLLADAPATSLVFASLCSANTVALTAAPLLRRLGGAPMSGWAVAVLAMLTSVVCAIAVAVAFGHGQADPSRFLCLALALLILFAILATVVWRGWQALQRRPHPFLGIAP